jgi:nitrate/nitrite transport system substrate-binding protein
MTQAARWGQTPGLPSDPERIARKAWRTDLYREIVDEMGIVCPSEDYKLEPGSRFIDGQQFDPSDLAAYLKSFKKAPTRNKTKPVSLIKKIRP